jgi:sugar phosphate permease
MIDRTTAAERGTYWALVSNSGNVGSGLAPLLMALVGHWARPAVESVNLRGGRAYES